MANVDTIYTKWVGKIVGVGWIHNIVAQKTSLSKGDIVEVLEYNDPMFKVFKMMSKIGIMGIEEFHKHDIIFIDNELENVPDPITDKKKEDSKCDCGAFVTYGSGASSDYKIHSHWCKIRVKT
jgi:hypothetical protein